jgi:hypothetical protein
LDAGGRHEGFISCFRLRPDSMTLQAAREAPPAVIKVLASEDYQVAVSKRVRSRRWRGGDLKVIDLGPPSRTGMAAGIAGLRGERSRASGRRNSVRIERGPWYGKVWSGKESHGTANQRSSLLTPTTT